MLFTWLSGEASAWQRRRQSFNTMSGRPPEEGNGYPLQYSCLENPMHRGAWRATVHRITKSQTQLSDWTTTLTQLFSTPGDLKLLKLSWLIIPFQSLLITPYIYSSFEFTKLFDIIAFNLSLRRPYEVSKVVTFSSLFAEKETGYGWNSTLLKATAVKPAASWGLPKHNPLCTVYSASHPGTKKFQGLCHVFFGGGIGKRASCSWSCLWLLENLPCPPHISCLLNLEPETKKSSVCLFAFYIVSSWNLHFCHS